MKTIGVLGGIGPQATMEFEQHVHRAAQRLIPPAGNNGYPGMVVWYMREAPIITVDGIRPRLPIETNPKLLEAAAYLGRVADFLVVASNGVHAMQAELEAAAGKPILSMVELVVDDVVRRGWRSVGALAFLGSAIYATPLTQRGLNVETIAPELQQPLDGAIISVMEGRDDDTQAAHGLRAVETLRSRGSDGVVLGCTEIPILLRDARHAPDLIDPLEILAEAAVRRAMA